MSITNSIRLTLNLTEENLQFDENFVKEQQIGKIKYLVYQGLLSAPPPNYCKYCGCVNKHNEIIKHGTKTVSIKLPQISNRDVILKLKKQRYLCKHCNKTMTIDTTITKPNCSISTNTYHSVLLQVKHKQSIKDIALQHDISDTTIHNWLGKLKSLFKIKRNYLPEHLCFDEFKSVKSCAANMSFLFVDATNGKVMDIVYNRRYAHLRSYFYQYSYSCRKKVKTICIDMYAPYISLIKSCFPNAKIIIDRFHII